MRLFLLPISTRRTLIYAQRLAIPSTEQQTFLEKGTKRAAKLWAGWEKKESGWQRKVVDYGNMALKRIPYEEWGLKSIPPLSGRHKEEALSEKKLVEVSFPSSLIPEQKVTEVLRILGTERQALHKSRMIYSFIGMPISAPFALIPIALEGSKTIQFLLDNKLIKPNPSAVMNELYAAANTKLTPDNETAADMLDKTENKDKETMILSNSNAKTIAKALEIPELEMELDRAIWQVENKLKSQEELKEETVRLNVAAPESQVKPQEKEKM